MKDNDDENNEWLAVIGRSLAFLCLAQADLRDKDLATQGQFLVSLGISRKEAAAPGSHDIYYVDLSDLNEIIRANSHLFLPVIPDIDAWMARIEQIRLPRNIVAHMNWPHATDRKRIDVFFADLQLLAQSLSAHLKLAAP